MKDFYEWQSGLSGKIEEVNDTLLKNIYTEQDELYEMSRYTIDAGGKRFRPLLTILSFEISSREPYQKILELSAGYELIHTASLIHDDIIDGSSLRRGRSTVNAKYGINNAIVVGDYLFAKAYELGSRYGPAVSKIMADAASLLAEGQILEAVNLANLSMDEYTYYEIIKKKTAMFFSACALGATHVAGADPVTQKNLTDFAYNLGMAFQITDDIIDVVGNEQKMGKPSFVDLEHNAITIPVIVALKQSSESDKSKLRQILTEGTAKEEDKDLMKDILVRSGSIDYSFSVAKRYTENALKSLQMTDRSADLDLLVDLATIVIDRISQLE
ncbi:MAG: octaprenyl-diphosphate synthase [Thermoplasmatales archaeon B_DKE]|nr:MAG: octaprenyl-diphosphate synthase [Thermoplasmatales archaeon B_DKE]QRF74755.1 Geranylgeranyl diphosphate synthase [Thermoplasmatales archaeon]